MSPPDRSFPENRPSGHLHVLYTAGGTGGTLTPLLAVAERLRAMRPQLLQHFLISPNEAERSLVARAGFAATEFQAGKLRRYWSVQNLRDALLLPRQTFRAWRWLRRRRPRLVVTAGSYNGVPFGWAARVLGIALLVHQQDVEPGLANRLVAPFAARTTVTFASSAAHGGFRDAVWTGNPVRRDVLDGNADAARRAFGIRPDRLLLLVLGGSTGAQFLNRLVAAALPHLVSCCNVLHVTGLAQRAATASSDGYTAVPFLTEHLQDALAAADIVVSRGGIATLSELALLGKPTILVPMPGTHQEANAALFAREHAALVLDQRSLTPALFVRTVTALVRDGAHRQFLGRAIGRMNRHDAAERLQRIVLDLLGQP